MSPIDLTLTISESIPSFPGSPAPQFLSWSDLDDDGYNLELLFLSSHTGTHMDAPYHFARGGKRIDQIPVRRFTGEAILAKLAKKADSPITKSDIVSFERSDGRIPKGASVFFHTGWQRNLKKDSYFARNPGLDAPAARYLAAKKANLVGIDSPSIDLGTDGSFRAHRILAAADVLIVENLANLDRIRSGRFRFTILPLKLRGATGSPVRAIASQC